MAAMCDQTPSAAMETAALFADADDGSALDTEGSSTKVLDKNALVSPNDDDLETLIDRLRLRLREGRGECIYEVGVAEHSDDAGSFLVHFSLNFLLFSVRLDFLSLID